MTSCSWCFGSSGSDSLLACTPGTQSRGEELGHGPVGRRNCRVSGSGHSPCPVRVAGRAGASVPARAQRRGPRPVVRGQARHLPGEVLDLLPIDFDPLLQGFDLLGLPLLFLRVLRGQHAAPAGANWRRSTGGVRGAVLCSGCGGLIQRIRSPMCPRTIQPPHSLTRLLITIHARIHIQGQGKDGSDPAEDLRFPAPAGVSPSHLPGRVAPLEIFHSRRRESPRGGRLQASRPRRWRKPAPTRWGR